MDDIYFDMAFEVGRIFYFGIPPSLLYSCLPKFTNGPLIFLGILSILVCFIFDDPQVSTFPGGGFFDSPPQGWRKGSRWFLIKCLELGSDWIALQLSHSINFNHTSSNLKEELIFMSWKFLYAFSISVMTISFLRSVLIFPWTVITLGRIRWSSFTDFDVEVNRIQIESNHNDTKNETNF